MGLTRIEFIEKFLKDNGYDFVRVDLQIIVDCYDLEGKEYPKFLDLIGLIQKNIEDWPQELLREMDIEINFPYPIIRFKFRALPID